MEIWKDVEGYVGLYQVSNMGRCRSLDRVSIDKNGFKKILKGKLLSPRSQLSGHLSVNLCKKGRPKQLLLHRLIGFAFLNDYFDGACIRHLDGDCKNNAVINLRWGTVSENSSDMYHRHGKRVGLNSHFSKYSNEEIKNVINLKGKVSATQASKLSGISRRYISTLWNGEAGFQKAEAFYNKGIDDAFPL